MRIRLAHVLGVVHLAVVVPDGTDEGVVLQAGRGAQGAAAGQVLVERHAAAVPAGDGHGVVQGDAGADVGPLQERLGQRVQERHRPGQVRGEHGEHQPALVQRFLDQAEVEHFEVAQAAVDELGGPGRCARGPVAGLHDADAEAARDGVQGGAGADDAAADDQDVEFLARLRRGPERRDRLLRGRPGPRAPPVVGNTVHGTPPCRDAR